MLAAGFSSKVNSITSKSLACVIYSIFGELMNAVLRSSRGNASVFCPNPGLDKSPHTLIHVEH